MVVHLIVAARPNFMKMAPLWRALKADGTFEPVLIHAGQHYDARMSDAFFEDLALPAPDHHLGVGSGTHAQQTGGVMIGYEPIALAERPDWVIVAGDVNATLACAVVAAKAGLRLVHLEAGLRSFDRTMPEEINRIATDAIADVLWTPSPDADEHLAAEGVDAARITRVGNIMIDSFEHARAAIAAAATPEQLGLRDKAYGVVTLHRPGNVDSADYLQRVTDVLVEAQRLLTLVFPVHPRTARRLTELGHDARLRAKGVMLLEPMNYIAFLSLVSGAAAAITDSGGLQEETTHLGIPCLTLRPNTERPITVTHGTNRLIDLDTLVPTLRAALSEQAAPAAIELWDGATATRCVDDLKRRTLALS